MKKADGSISLKLRKSKCKKIMIYYLYEGAAENVLLLLIYDMEVYLMGKT